MINFIVCDDNEVIRKQVEDLIIKVMMKNNLSYKVHLYSDYNKSFITMINQNLSNKIYILDIETPSESGINMARKIREKDIDSIIIFLTSHYELGPALLDEELMFLTFVSKFNNQEKRISSAINKALKMIGHKQAIRFEDRGTLYTLPVNDILYVTRDSVDRKCIVKTDYTEFRIIKTINEMEDLLGSSFIHTHRSCLANKNRIRLINKKDGSITFDNGEQIRLLSNMYKEEEDLR